MMLHFLLGSFQGWAKIMILENPKIKIIFEIEDQGAEIWHSFVKDLIFVVAAALLD